VANLVSVKDPATATALEVCAGGRLYQVVVDSAETGKLLLSKGKLQRRVTIIPMDKIRPKVLPKAKADRAQQVAAAAEAGATAQLALSLVGYGDEVRAAMEYVFGGSLVCSGNGEAAKQVCFDPQVKTRTVTLEGDAYDPAGLLSGGSKRSGGAVLLKLQKLNAAKAEMERLGARLDELDAQLKALKGAAKEHGALSKRVDLARHNLALTEQAIGQSQHGALVAQKKEADDALAAEADGAVAAAEAAVEAEKAAKRRGKELTAELADLKAKREREMKAM